MNTLSLKKIIALTALTIGIWCTSTVSARELNSTTITPFCLSSSTTCVINNVGVTSIASGTFASHNNLTVLNLGRNLITSLENGDFAGLSALRELQLHANQITSLESDDFNGINTTIFAIDMYLYNNRITSIENGTFARFGNMRWLNLLNNQITSIENGTFSGMNRLQDLYLNGNRITSIPSDTFAGLPNLGSLQLNDNRITSIAPDTFVNNSKLGNLGLIRNLISSLKSIDFPGVSKLTTLDLYGNQITSIDSGDFARFSSLTYLRLSFNQITSLENGDFAGLPALTTLEINNNRIASLESGDFAGLPALTTLNFGGNQITSLENGDFAGLPALTSLNFWGNPITSLENGDFAGLNNLRTLNIGNSQLTSLENGDFAGLPALTSLNLANSRLVSIGNGAFTGLPTLTSLSLDSTQLISLESGDFTGLPALTSLSLRNNTIRSIQNDAFIGLRPSTSISLTNNCIDPTNTALTSYLNTFTSIAYGSQRTSGCTITTTNGVCGTADSKVTDTFPTANLCSVGTPIIHTQVDGTISVFTWKCQGTGSGSIISSCTSYKNPTTSICVPYGQNGSTLPSINSNITGTGKALMLGYDFTSNLAKIPNPIKNTDGITLGNASGVYYTDSNTYNISTIINPNISLKVTFTNRNTQGNKGQFVQYREPKTPNTWYGCSASGWNVSLTGVVPSELLSKVSSTRIASTDNTDDRENTPAPTKEADFRQNTMPKDASQLLAWSNSTITNKDGMLYYSRFYIPRLNKYVNRDNPEEVFFAWKQLNGFEVNCEVCSTPTPAATQTGTCIGLPANAIPNTATSITQYATGTNGWTPSTTYVHSMVTDTKNCTFKCNTNYTRSGTTLTCIADTRTADCGTQPANTDATNGITYIQTRNGTTWAPTTGWTLGASICGYTCKTNNTRNGSACVPNTSTTTCNVAGFAVPNATIVAIGTFTTLRNNTSNTWVLNPSLNTGRQYTGPTTSPAPNSGCYYSCNADSVWTGGVCVKRIYNRKVNDWGMCPVTG